MLAEGGSSLFKRNGGWQQWARWRAWAALSALAMVVAPARIAWAHGGQPLAPHDLWRAWNLAPSLWLGLGLSAWLYARRIRVLAQRRLRPPALRSACFVAGLLAAFVALVSPLDAQASVLFAAHMAQHMLLVLVAAPLVALSRPLGPTLLGLPKGPRRAPGRGWQAAVLWAWHVPGLYQAALRHPLAHGLEHLSLAGTALLFWWSALWPSRRAGPNYGASVLGLFATLMLGSPLGRC